MARNGICVEVLYCAVFLMTIADCEIVDGYQFPVYTTKICPRNQTEWKNRSSAIHCTDFKGYMCVPNEDFTMLLEFCYESYKIAIQPGVCLFLTKKNSVVNIYDCTQFTSGCPKFPYLSDEMYKHQNCVWIKEGCFLAESACYSKSTSFPITTIDTSTNNIKTENNNKSNNSTRPNAEIQQQNTTHSNNTTNFESKDQPENRMAILGVIFVPLWIITVSIAIYQQRKRFACCYQALAMTETD